MVVSEQGEKKILVDYPDENVNEEPYLDNRELWPYVSGYVKDWPVQMGVISHNIEIYPHPYLPLNVDSIRHELFADIKSVYGEMYLKNNTDSTVYLSSDTDKHYVIANQGYSLYFSLCDSLPIVLKPHQSKEIRYRSIPLQGHFFKNLVAKEHPWENFSNLFSESTYCLLKINQEDLKIRVMNFYVPSEFKVTAGKDDYLLRILPPGIYDKEAREKRNVKFWLKDHEDKIDKEDSNASPKHSTNL